MNHAEANEPSLARNYEGISANLLHAEGNVKLYIKANEKFINNSEIQSSLSSNDTFTQADRTSVLYRHHEKCCCVNYASRGQFTWFWSIVIRVILIKSSVGCTWGTNNNVIASFRETWRKSRFHLENAAKNCRTKIRNLSLLHATHQRDISFMENIII